MLPEGGPMEQVLAEILRPDKPSPTSVLQSFLHQVKRIGPSFFLPYYLPFRL